MEITKIYPDDLKTLGELRIGETFSFVDKDFKDNIRLVVDRETLSSTNTKTVSVSFYNTANKTLHKTGDVSARVIVVPTEIQRKL